MSIFQRLGGDDRARFERQLSKEAEYYARTIQQRLTQMGLCYRYKKSEKDFTKSNVQEVEFNKGAAPSGGEGIYLWLNTAKLPRGVTIDNFRSEEVQDDLSVNCERPVRFVTKPGRGAFFLVERESGVWGLPREVSFTDMIEHYPDSSRKSLVVPMGVGSGDKMIFRSLAEAPHALVGGSTGRGKTTFLHSWITTLVLKNDPRDLRLALVDLKGGVEFGRYRELPHLMDNEFIGMDLAEGGFVKKNDDLVPLLSFLQKEVDRRLWHFDNAGGIQNLAIWNHRRRSQHMPRLVFIADEIQSVQMLEKSGQKQTYRFLADISARGRAPGIHVVLATQRPTVDVIPGRVQGNLDWRIAFAVPDNASSQVILDTTEAAKMGEDAPPGRLIFRSGIDRMDLQAPDLTDKQIDRYLKSILEGRAEEVVHDQPRITPEQIFKLSVGQLDGHFGVEALHKALGGRVSYDYLLRLAQDFEGEVFEVSGELYELHPPAGRTPRRLLPVDYEEDPLERDGEPPVEDILIRVLDELDGKFSINPTYDHFGREINIEYLKDIGRELEGKEIELRGEVYRLKPSAGPIPRTLVRVKGEG